VSPRAKNEAALGGERERECGVGEEWACGAMTPIVLGPRRGSQEKFLGWTQPSSVAKVDLSFPAEHG
jgi:hypothetical protein